MSVQDETWDRPTCNICCTEIKYGEKNKHGAGKCDSDSAHSGLGKLPKLTPVCEHCFQPYPFSDAPKHKDGKCNEICTKCGSPVHPCFSCEEVVMLHGNKTDWEYCRLLHDILENGRRKSNRTGIDTFGLFGEMAKFEVRMDAFPILTTKKVWFKGIVHELLWFIKGDTNIKYLVDNDVHIWDEWAYARYKKSLAPYEYGPDGGLLPTEPGLTQDQFIQLIKEDEHFAQQFGELGEGTYGGMWRAFPYAYEAAEFEYGGQKGTEIKIEHIDQLKKVIDKLKTNPDDRRMIVSAWHPYWVDHCALPPCHCLFHFNTEELTKEEREALATPEQRSTAMASAIGAYDNEGTYFDTLTALGVPRRRLNLLLYQRSCDTFLGVPFNITSYSLLLALIAHCVGMEPGTFTHTYGDLHIYENHLEQVNLQLSRTPKVLPSLWLNPDKRDLFAFTFDDIKLEGYDPHPTIKASIAV